MAYLHTFRGRKRVDLVNADIPGLLFRNTKTGKACRLFMTWLKENRRETTPKELGKWLRKLQNGEVKTGFKYRREHFYVTVLRPLMKMGFVNKQVIYPRTTIYAPEIQPIPNKPPPLTTWWGVAYLIALKWNEEWK